MKSIHLFEEVLHLLDHFLLSGFLGEPLEARMLLLLVVFPHFLEIHPLSWALYILDIVHVALTFSYFGYC